MRKLITSIVIVLSLLLAVPFSAYGEVCINTEETVISSVSELKEELEMVQDDGIITDLEKETLTACTDEAVINSFINEKLTEAVDVLDTEDCTMSEGSTYEKKVYQLEDGCQLIVELEDCSEDESNIQTRATSGSSTLWKAYGNRYFTAKATVDFGLGTATLQMQNHYILSKKGIDENYGTSAVSWTSSVVGDITRGTPVITDAYARTVGASDVNMYCYYTLTEGVENGTPITTKYKIATTVGFVDLDTDEGKVKVKQSWKLTKV